MAHAVGIDLGTTNTVVAAVRDGVVTTLADSEGHRLLPSVVSFHPSGSVMVGHPAVDRRLIDARNTIYSIKRLIGRPWGAAEVQQVKDKFPFELREGPKSSTQAIARGDAYALPEISAFVLRQAKALAEAALGEPVERAVITVPANFNDLQRAATKTAGRLANLEVLRILNEPTAAALAYGPTGQAHERVAIYDLGGGTFDVTLLDLAGNVFEVLATAGDSALGGDDVDVVIAERMADDLLKKHRFDARANSAAFGRLRLVAERVKRDLSKGEETTVLLDDLVPGDRGGATHWSFRMTRPELEWAALPVVERSFQVCQQALAAAGIGATDLDRVILVGGSTRMPLVARKVEQFFGRSPVVRINPDEVVALGAAIQAGLLDRTRGRPVDSVEAPRVDEASIVAPLPFVSSSLPEASELPIVHGKGRAVAAVTPRAPELPRDAVTKAVPQSHFLPGVHSKPLVFESPQSPNPSYARADPPPLPPVSRAALPIPAASEATAAPPRVREDSVAVDAPPAGRSPAAAPVAVERPRPAPPRRAPLLIDVTPLSLSVETVGGFCDTLIDANTPVPCDRTRSFSTASDGQTSVRVRVAQGESRRFADNTFLGEVELTELTAVARGKAQIDVTFEIDADGILAVRAREGATGREIAARIQLVGARTDPAEIEAMRARQAAHPLASGRG